jgi:mannose-6-phosphate isomerase
MSNEQMTNEGWYPLCLQTWAREMIWGGRNLEHLLGKSLAPGKTIGETWEAWDGCVIENGKHRGMTLGNLLEQDAAAVLGSVVTIGARFPLLFKFIDAHEDLSVQVHPGDAAAQAIEHQPFGKTEAWYVIHAEPNACLIHGFKEDVNAERVTEYLGKNKLQDLLAYVPVQSGDVVFVPAGTVHAIMEGIVLAEIQENSDITYRLNDWGREDQGRPLHIAQSMRVLEFKQQIEHKIPSLTIDRDEFDHHYLVACRYFSFELLDIRQPLPGFQLNDRFNVLSVIQGAASITFGQDFASSVGAKYGQTVLLPARLGVFGISPQATPCKILRMYVPDLRADVIEPLTRAGHSAVSIAQLGGASPQHNDLIPLLTSG